MPYAVRDHLGRITSLHRHDPGVGDLLAADDPELAAFLGLDAPPGSPPRGELGDEPEGNFVRLDAEFIRVLEDVIDALVSRNVLTITDLPDIAQTKLFARRSFRERWPKDALSLFNPGDLGNGY
jgi:hypothetical protein